MSDSTLVFIERFAWWFHIIGILAFGVYVTYSKHLHIFWLSPTPGIPTSSQKVK
jgi:hypothetical protein